MEEKKSPNEILQKKLSLDKKCLAPTERKRSDALLPKATNSSWLTARPNVYALKTLLLF